MKTIIIGDIHGRSIWKKIIQQEDPDRIVFLGDYFDSFDVPGIDQIHNFKEIIDFKKSSDKEVILLVGNHDLHYMNIGETYSGFQAGLKFDISSVLFENLSQLQMAFSFDRYLCTHAGVSHVWMENTFGVYGWDCWNLVEKINQLFVFRPKDFRFEGWDSYGNDVTQSPVWIRIPALLDSNKKRRADSNYWIKKNFVQIMGHTSVKDLNLVHMRKYMGGKYYMADALEIGKFLIDIDGKLSVGEIS